MAVLVWLASLNAARAQTHQHDAGENHREPYVVPAVRVDQAPRIDGSAGTT